MKTIISIITLLVSNILFSQYIEGLSVTQNGTNQIKVHVKAYFPTSESSYLSYETALNQNVITLNPCYYLSPFGGSGDVTYYSNDFYIDVPNGASYTLKVNMYISTNNTICNHNRIEDTVTLNFTTPIQGTVSLAANESDVSEQDLKLFPIPAKDELIIITKNRINNINVLDASGRKVSATFLNNKVNTSNLQNGIYFIEIFSDKGLARKKFTIKK